MKTIGTGCESRQIDLNNHFGFGVPLHDTYKKTLIIGERYLLYYDKTSNIS